jgi:hypothetical protein
MIKLSFRGVFTTLYLAGTGGVQKRFSEIVRTKNATFPVQTRWSPRGCLEIWLAYVQGDHPTMETEFAAAHDQLNQKVETILKMLYY